MKPLEISSKEGIVPWIMGHAYILNTIMDAITDTEYI
jgi:hypothetical protein